MGHWISTVYQRVSDVGRCPSTVCDVFRFSKIAQGNSLLMITFTHLAHWPSLRAPKPITTVKPRCGWEYFIPHPKVMLKNSEDLLSCKNTHLRTKALIYLKNQANYGRILRAATPPNPLFTAKWNWFCSEGSLAISATIHGSRNSPFLSSAVLCVCALPLLSILFVQ